MTEIANITEPTTEAEKNPQIDQALVARLTKEFNDFNNSLKTKVYPIKVESLDVLDKLIDFIENKAAWKNMESLGIIEISKALREERGKGIKSGNIYVNSLAVQAISFFLSKVESVGINAAEQHISFVRPIDEALKLIKLDNDQQNRLNSELAAAENGITVESEPSENNDKSNG